MCDMTYMQGTDTQVFLHEEVKGVVEVKRHVL
jgi:hypothetical protein